MDCALRKGTVSAGDVQSQCPMHEPTRRFLKMRFPTHGSATAPTQTQLGRAPAFGSHSLAETGSLIPHCLTPEDAAAAQPTDAQRMGAQNRLPEVAERYWTRIPSHDQAATATVSSTTPTQVSPFLPGSWPTAFLFNLWWLEHSIPLLSALRTLPSRRSRDATTTLSGWTIVHGPHTHRDQLGRADTHQVVGIRWQSCGLYQGPDGLLWESREQPVF